MPVDTRRIAREVKDCQQDSDKSTVYCDFIKTNHLKGLLKGPADTPYANGWFVVDIRLSDQYPFFPPQCKFETQLWHPNVSSQTGAICLDILTTKSWSPAHTMKTILLSLVSLLQCPVPDDPQDHEVASMLLRDPAEFQQTAAFWTEMYASQPSVELVKQVQDIAQVSEYKACLLLLMNDCSVEKAIVSQQ